MINRAPVVLKKPVAIVQILQAASFVSRIFNSVISLPFCSCIFSTIILCLVTLANLCLYYLIILSKVCVFMICFFSSKFVCLSFDKYSKVRLFIILQISTGLCVKYLTMVYKVFVFSIWHLRVFYKVCVFTIWSPPNWMRSCEKGGSGHLQPKLEGNSEFEETERKLRLWSKLCTTLTLLVSWQGQGHSQTISRKYEKSTLCDISNNLAIAKSKHL